MLERKFLVFILFLATLSSQAQRGNKFMFVFLTPSNSMENTAVQEIENEHLRNISRLADQGYLVNAGPFEGGGEILIFNTSSREETEKLLQKDPAIEKGLYKMEILNWSLRFGGICDPLVPYEMKTYSFIRFIPINQIASFKTSVDLKMKTEHQKHLERLMLTGEVVVEGEFSGNEGGIMVYNENMLNSLVKEDPSVLNGYMRIEERIIWLNKGSFCDK